MPFDTKAAEDIFLNRKDNHTHDAKDGRTWLQHVKEFSSTASQGNIPNKPVMMSVESARFIREMLNDEMDELDEAVDEFWNSDKDGDITKDCVKVADALIDAIYYLLDTAVKHGYDLDPLFLIVQKANMAKFKNGVKRRPDGKVLKPADWVDPEPQLIEEMRKQINNGNSI